MCTTEIDTALEISGQTVHIGSKVNVKWLESWYEGEVMGFGPEKDLYQVTESLTGLPILLHKSQMKAIDQSRSIHQRYTTGAEIGFYDNDLGEWLSGTIQVENAEGDLFVKWKRNKSNNENLNWFEKRDVAPIIQNESFGMETESRLPLHQSEVRLPEINTNTSLEDILQDKPRYRKNAVFNENLPSNTQEPFENHLPDIDQFMEDFDSRLHIKPRRTSVSMKEFYARRFQKTPPQGKTENEKLDNYLQNQDALLKGKLDHSLLPPIWSYLSSTKGIPHHPCSRYFLHYYNLRHHSEAWRRTPAQLSSNGIKRARSAQITSNLTTSPTMNYSEPSPYTQIPLTQERIPNMRRQRTDMSLRPLPALPFQTDTSYPYEVPLPLSKTNSHVNMHPYESNEMYTKVDVHDSISRPRSSHILVPSTRPTSKAPSITSSSKSELLVSAGGTVTLFCEVSSETPPTFEWFKNGQKLTHNDERIAFPGPGKLQVYGLTKANAGIYQCTVSNEGGNVVYKCKLNVEEETLKRSFSREMGLHKLAVESDTEEIRSDRTGEETEEHSYPNVQELSDDDFHSQAPQYKDYPMDMTRPPSSLESTFALLEKDKERLASDGKEKIRKKREERHIEFNTPDQETQQIVIEKSVSAPVSFSDLDERKSHKEKRRRVSNVLLDEMESYLEGYGDDYGQSSHILDVPTNRVKTADKGKRKSKKTPSKKNKEKKIKSPDKSVKKSKSAFVLSKKQQKDSLQAKSDSKLNALKDYRDERSTTKVPRVIDVSVVDEYEVDEDDGDFDPQQAKQFNIPVIIADDEEPTDMVREEGEEQENVEFQSFLSDPNENELEEPPLYKLESDHLEVEPGEDKDPQDPYNLESSHSHDSIDAHPSFETLESVSEMSEEDTLMTGESEGRKLGSNNVDLPLESQHYSESVRRLQISTQEYEEDHFGKDKPKKQSMLKKIFKSNNSKITVI